MYCIHRILLCHLFYEVLYLINLYYKNMIVYFNVLTKFSGDWFTLFRELITIL